MGSLEPLQLDDILQSLCKAPACLHLETELSQVGTEGSGTRDSTC